jgi:hypothetical protein
VTAVIHVGESRVALHSGSDGSVALGLSDGDGGRVDIFTSPEILREIALKTIALLDALESGKDNG